MKKVLIVLIIAILTMSVSANETIFQVMDNDNDFMLLGTITYIKGQFVTLKVEDEVLNVEAPNGNEKVMRPFPQNINILDFKYTYPNEFGTYNLPKKGDKVFVALYKYQDGIFKVKQVAYKLTDTDYRNAIILAPQKMFSGEAYKQFLAEGYVYNLFINNYGMKVVSKIDYENKVITKADNKTILFSDAATYLKADNTPYKSTVPINLWVVSGSTILFLLILVGVVFVMKNSVKK